jgi:hypothetical protein
MSLFDFDEEIEQERAAALTDSDRASVRTTVSQQRLPEAVRAAGWRFLYRGDEFDPAGQSAALVIGVAPWNEPELRALDGLFAASAGAPVRIWVFDIDDCENAEDIARVLPGVKPPVRTPVVAKYIEGGLARSAEGADAIDLLAHANE